MAARLSFAIGLICLLTSCGKVGDPLPPFIRIPERAANFSVAQSGYELHFNWTNPSRNVDQSASLDLARAFILNGETVFAEASVSGPGEFQSLVLPAQGLLGSSLNFSIYFETARGRVSGRAAAPALTVVEVPGPGGAVRAVVDQNEIALQWSLPATNAAITDAYRVYRSGIALTEVHERHFADTGYREGVTYVYTVVPLRLNGSAWVEGLPYEAVSVTAVDRVPPAPPLGLSLTPFDAGVFLRWESSREADVVRYGVFRRDTPGGEFQRIGPVEQTANAFRDPGYRPGYAYAVTARDRSGNESPLSIPVSD